MIRALSNFRLVPVVLVAAICLFTLKTLGLVFDGGYILHGFGTRDGDESDITGTVAAPKRAAAEPEDIPVPPPPVKQSWAQQMFNYPDVTGSVPEPKAPAPPPPKEAAKDAAKAKQPENAPPGSGWTPLSLDRQASLAERAILERLQERRTELDARAKELEMRESLLMAAEKRLEGRIGELKELEARVNNAVQAKTDGEAARFKHLITMYDNMKAKDAAKIFDRLEMRLLAEVATQLNARRMSEIMAQMSPDTAERLTVELAVRAKDKAPELPKIEGKPATN